jgi:hypothetical protein
VAGPLYRGLVQPQQPFCPIPERSEAVPLWAYRWAPANNNGMPEAYRMIGIFELRDLGPATYEVALQEQVAWSNNNDGVPATPPGPSVTTLEDRVSGVLRLRLRSGGSDIARWTHARQTTITTGEYLAVEYWLPERAVILERGQSLPPIGPGETSNVVVGRANIRVLATPARSRRPSEWRIADWIQLAQGDPPPDPSNAVRFVAGCSEFRILPSPLQGYSIVTIDPTIAGLNSDPLATFGPASVSNEFAWMPCDGAAGLIIIPPGPIPPVAQQYMVTQRGWW